MRGAEGVAHHGGDGVAVLFGGDPDQVPGGRLRAEDLGDAGERDQLPQLGRPPDLAASDPAGEVLAARTARRSILSCMASS